MAASTPDLTKLEAEMREKALAFGNSCWYAGPLAWFESSQYDGRKLGIYDGPDLVCVMTDFEHRVRRAHAHIAASCPSNVIAVLDGKDAEIARLTRELREARGP